VSVRSSEHAAELLHHLLDAGGVCFFAEESPVALLSCVAESLAQLRIAGELDKRFSEFFPVAGRK